MVPTEVEGYGRLTPSKRALPLRNSQLGWVHEASAGTLIETPAFLSSVFQLPSSFPLIAVFLELSGSITASCSHTAKIQQETPYPPTAPPPTSPPTLTF